MKPATAPIDPQMMEALSGMERPIPGQSLTSDPENPQAYEQAPKHTDLRKAQEEIMSKLMEEENYMPIMSVIQEEDASIMEVTQNLLYSGFRAGMWNPDMMMLLVEPTAYMVMALAERAGIDYEVTHDPDAEDGEVLEGNEGDRLSKLQSQMNKKAPKSLNENKLPPKVQEMLDEAPTSLLAPKEETMPEEAEAPTQEPASLLGAQTNAV